LFHDDQQRPAWLSSMSEGAEVILLGTEVVIVARVELDMVIFGYGETFTIIETFVIPVDVEATHQDQPEPKIISRKRLKHVSGQRKACW
jgi:hypothetical protein